jgi:hypothetical protein
MPGRLGLIAGGGDLPVRLLDACRASGREVFVVALEGQAAPSLVGSDTPHAWARIGAAGRIVDLLRQAGVEELIMAGKVERPSLAALRPDWRALKFLAARGGRLGSDDDFLSSIIRAIEREEGIRVVSPTAVLGDLAAPWGPLGRCRPDAEDDADIALGLGAARQLGALDIGQAVVVQQGRVLALEAVEGTDGLIARAGALQQPGRAGILVKIPKPQQELRADPPTIGPETIRQVGAARLGGVALAAGATLVLDRAEVIRLADAAGIFVVGVDVS